MRLLCFTCIFGLCYVTVFSIQWDLFSTKTLYEWSHEVDAPLGDNTEMLTSHNDHLCNAVHVNAVIRHGARNPSLKNINKMTKLRDKLVANKPPDVALFMDLWKNLYAEEDEKQLVAKGIKEQFELGRRFSRKFFRLLDRARADDIEFITSSKFRAKDSAEFFYGGLSAIFSKLERFDSEIKDDLMRFYDNCGNYEMMVENNRTNFKEFFDFHKTEDYINVSKAIRRNLSLNISLDPDEVYILYEMCAYETYIYNNSLWCNVMTDADRRVLEYGQDLEKYYESSYGHPLNTRLSCPLVDKIFDELDEVIEDIKDNDNHTAGIFQFGHSETIVQLFTALGLFKDIEPLLATNFARMTKRQFRTSKISPYSANIAFVLFACAEPGRIHDYDGKNISAYVLKILVNEKPVIIPACNKEQCIYEDVKKYYHDLVDHCNHEAMCGGDYDHHDDEDDDDHDHDNGPGGQSWKMAYSLHLLIVTTLISFINLRIAQ